MLTSPQECSPAMLVMLITPPPIDEEGRMAYARSLYGDKAMELPERTNEVTGVYAKQCVELAKELGLSAREMPSEVPHHSEIDGKDPQKAFQLQCS
ncbi:SGNH hydrolase-type esterase superfamily protein [Actinidia rufa]|uniref:SGNH hydrolase-type esterase superfamily protein n=1 Tax=Actinidia rufa TaxID=165716 RepID=A0A7J0FYL5_9ERIC|nr:SGNH hydrolase-type esterase superfamily protein [Actinidia rufa]